MNECFFTSYTIGADAYRQIPSVCAKLGKRVLILGGETALTKAMPKLKEALGEFTVVDVRVYGKECFAARAEQLFAEYRAAAPDFVIGVGGGKALDTAKFVADLMGVPVVTVPTIASTCASSSALSVVYTEDHVFAGFRYYARPAYHCFIDTEIIAAAPYTFVRAGIGDTLAKFYEVSFSMRGRALTFQDEMGLSISRMCSEPLFKTAQEAVRCAKEHRISEALEQTALIILISTGMVSMLINSDFNGAMAHALFYGLTNLPGFEERFLHGDVVGYCTIVQLLMDGQTEEAERVRAVLRSIGVETTLAERGISLDREAFDPILEAALADPDMKVVPYEVTKEMIFGAMCRAEESEGGSIA